MPYMEQSYELDLIYEFQFTLFVLELLIFSHTFFDHIMKFTNEGITI